MASDLNTTRRTRPRAPRMHLGADARERVLAVLDSGRLNAWYGGTAVRNFEQAFAPRFGRSLAVACNSGTSALHLAYSALDLPPGSEVLIPANAYVSAATAALQCELVPVIVDIDPDTWVMAAADLERKLTDQTRAVVPVHMYGQPCDLDAVEAFAARHRLVIVEDAAASHGARWSGRPIGSCGLVSCFSVCCFKLVSSGEGGVVVTDDPEVATRCRMLAHKGKGEGFFDYRMPGYSYHMSELQAAVAHATLSDLDGELAERTTNAEIIRSALPDLGCVVQPQIPGTTHGLFKLPVRLPSAWQVDVEAAAVLLRQEGVPVVPAHPYLLDIGWLRERHHPAFRNLGLDAEEYDPESCPTANRLMRRVVTVDVGPGLDTVDMELMVEGFRRVDTAMQRSSLGG